MKLFWALVLVAVGAAVSACAPTQTPTQSAVSTPQVDEGAYKAQFDQNFQQSCYAGFENSFVEQNIAANDADLQAAQNVCACIAYNLVNNNSAAQLQSLESMSASAAQEVTQPLVDSCSEQVWSHMNAASAPNSVSAASGN
ncbi:hypothetical protein LVJ82_13470 [Vitreoscilla massiliensis]|uniref:Lipoprotein n=1 Tax=Vitreoscilla massiliensis TaxID=1689272 RepID=A0ABY4DYZ8_9NEIS|nr:hypothetical protein [Vitreoscilla massiliensis]UOO88469.1 hypothetical protein LVJ82_13470 [Vitreoscilla massiliensis]